MTWVTWRTLVRRFGVGGVSLNSFQQVRWECLFGRWPSLFGCLAFLCLCGAMSAMDCKKKFQDLLQKVGLCSKVQEELAARGFATAAELHWTLQSGAEETIDAVLQAAGVDKGCAPSLLQCLEAGRLRRLLAMCTKVCNDAGDQAPVVSDAAGTSLLGLSVGPQLDAAQLAELWKKFAADYPSECLEADGQPCKQLLQQIALQKRNGELKFIPWKQILSVVQYDRSRQSCSHSKEKSLLGLLADVTGHVDALEADVSSSPFAVQKVLSLRSVAWALLDWCHLSSGKMLVNKFMLLYHRVGLADVGMRPPNLAEAEFADAELCRQLQDLMSKGNDLDRAIYEAVVVRDSLRLWLQPRLKAPAEKGRRPSPYGAETTSAGKGRGQGKGKGKDKGVKRAKGLCWSFQEGKCTMRDECKFKHHCDHCGSAEHGRHACAKLLQLAKED